MRRVVMLGALVLVGALSVVGVASQQGQLMVETEKLEDNLYVLRGGGGNSAAFITSDTGWCWSIRSSRAGGSRS